MTDFVSGGTETPPASLLALPVLGALSLANSSAIMAGDSAEGAVRSACKAFVVTGASQRNLSKSRKY